MHLLYRKNDGSIVILKNILKAPVNGNSPAHNRYCGLIHAGMIRTQYRL